MKENIKSVVRFEDYIVKKVEFAYNFAYKESDEGVAVDFDIDVDFKVNEEKNEMFTGLKLVVFDNPTENNYPFTLKLELVGIFSINTSNKENIENYKTNTLAILFPYARSLVSSYTANANVTPLILPAININKFVEHKKGN